MTILLRRGWFAVDAPLLVRLARQLAATAAMALVLAAVLPVFAPMCAGGLLSRLEGLAGLVGAGLVSFFAAAFGSGALDKRRLAPATAPRTGRSARSGRRHLIETEPQCASSRASSRPATFTSATIWARSATGCGCRTRSRRQAGESLYFLADLHAISHAARSRPNFRPTRARWWRRWSPAGSIPSARSCSTRRRSPRMPSCSGC